jgi:hypothetical protein
MQNVMCNLSTQETYLNLRYKIQTIIIVFLILTSCKTTNLKESNVNGNLFLDGITISHSMKLIGMYPYYDSDKTFQNYNFYIENYDDIISASKRIKLGENISNLATRNEFNIRLIDNGKIIKTWSINPQYSYIRTEGKTYKFDINQLKALSKKHGFNYSVEKRDFKNKREFDEFFKVISKEDSYLFMYKPNFKFEGKFDVKFPKSSEFIHPKAITKYLESKLEKISLKESFRVFYVLTEYNRNNRNQFTMTIESNYNLFSKFEDKNGIKKEWIPEVYSATIFRKE